MELSPGSVLLWLSSTRQTDLRGVDLRGADLQVCKLKSAALHQESQEAPPNSRTPGEASDLVKLTVPAAPRHTN